MSNYEEQYYIVDTINDEETLYLTVTDNTARRRCSYTKQNLIEGPLYFENSYKEEDLEEGIVRTLDSAHMNISNVIVNDKIANKLKHFNIQNFQLFPSVIIDDQDQYHEGYWFFNIYDKLDILDIENSEIDSFDPEEDMHNVSKFKFKSDILDTIPEEQRLIIKIKNLNRSITFVHKKIVDIFEEENVSTLKFMQLSKYYAGKQFEK